MRVFAAVSLMSILQILKLLRVPEGRAFERMCSPAGLIQLPSKVRCRSLYRDESNGTKASTPASQIQLSDNTKVSSGWPCGSTAASTLAPASRSRVPDRSKWRMAGNARMSVSTASPISFCCKSKNLKEVSFSRAPESGTTPAAPRPIFRKYRISSREVAKAGATASIPESPIELSLKSSLHMHLRCGSNSASSPAPATPMLMFLSARDANLGTFCRDEVRCARPTSPKELWDIDNVSKWWHKGRDSFSVSASGSVHPKPEKSRSLKLSRMTDTVSR
mmetsp:Transcript_49426/g.131199  ORF Transcript_49426/g.131199 Transcript_49426/m.131199 type:complete len:277 (+) Transcript_49426:390-1220(+)